MTIGRVLKQASSSVTPVSSRFLDRVPLHRPSKAGISPERFAQLDPVDRIRAIYDIHGERAVQLSSMQKTAGVIMHLIHRAGVNIPILFFDTQYLHQETYDVKEEFQQRYGLDIRTITPELTVEQQDRLHGKDLWRTKSGQMQCCYMRKEKPLLDTLQEMGVEATIAGLTRTEGGARKDLKPVDHDPRNQNELYYPIFDFSNKQIHAYTEEHKLPVHALYAKNFLSIGCAPCTTPVKPGEDARAGRWRHLREEGETHAYCGMNFSDVKPKPKSTNRSPLFKKKDIDAEPVPPTPTPTPLSVVRARFRGTGGEEQAGKVQQLSASS